MQFIDLREELKDFAVFNLNDIRKIEADFDLRRLNEWSGKGYIKNIRRGFYHFSDLRISEPELFLIANKIYSPSYVSLEIALSAYNLIPEAVYGVTSVTSQKTNSFATGIGNFIYKHIKPELMFGYELREHGNHRYAIARIEKAVLDFLYLNPRFGNDSDFDGLRFNAAEFKAGADMAKFDKYLGAFGNNVLSRRAGKFIKFINNA